MLDLELINRLYKGLSKEEKHKLLFDLFGTGRQSMSYFSRTNDTSLSKVEIMSRAFGVPVDTLLKDSPYTYSSHSKRLVRTNIGESAKPADSEGCQVSDRIAELEKEIFYLKEISELKDDKLKLLEDMLGINNPK